MAVWVQPVRAATTLGCSFVLLGMAVGSYRASDGRGGCDGAAFGSRLSSSGMTTPSWTRHWLSSSLFSRSMRESPQGVHALASEVVVFQQCFFTCLPPLLDEHKVPQKNSHVLSMVR